MTGSSGLALTIDTPEKNWKITPDDIKERHYWEQYRKTYEDCLSATTTEEAPWHIVPADDKRNARLFVSQIILDALDDLDMRFPETTAERRRELGLMRKALGLGLGRQPVEQSHQPRGR